MTQTIFALASGSTRSGVAVIRVSGPLAAQTLETLSGKKLPPPRHAAFCKLPGLDDAIVIYFKAPASFTGEDVVEYHLHGGLAVIDGVQKALSAIDGCRVADPGEFTRRAFENGKMDLTEAEAVADLIDAETQAQRLQALDQLSGSLSKLYKSWSDRLAHILAHQEADIEFPEDDLPQGIADTQKTAVAELLTQIRAHLDDGRRGERLRSGIRIAIIGAPNAGKSSLLNILARKDAAIVSSEAGTTRDVIEVHLDLGGYPVILSDTAGLRETNNLIEIEGIKRARRTASDADLKLAVFDGTSPVMDAETSKLIDDKTIVVITKADLYQSRLKGIQISSETGAGMDVLLHELEDRIAAFFKSGGGPVLSRERHREALIETAVSLERSLAATLPELAAEDLRLALRAVGRITGRVHIEELLDKIFRDFCIGK